MPWPADFINALSGSDLKPRLTFECVPEFDRFISGNPMIGAYKYSGDWKFSTHALPGYIPAIMKDESTLGGAVGRLSTGSWSMSRGTWSVALALSPTEVAVLRGQMTRGQGCCIKMGFSSDLATFEVFLLGVVRQLSRRRGTKYIVQCDDITAYLGSRARPTAEVEPGFAGQSALFHQMLEEPTTLAAGGGGGYTPGDAVVYVTSANGSQRSSEGLYLIEITPDPPGGGGEPVPFYLTATDKNEAAIPPELTGCSATGVYGTTAAAAAVGNAVRMVAHDVGHPIDITRRILVSSGLRDPDAGPPPTPGTNGPFDMLHESWGFNIDQAWIDHDDCEFFKLHAESTFGLDGWVMLVTQPQTNTLAWLSGWLAPGGYWLAQRQGMLTVRAVLDVEAFDNAPTISITDADIKQITSYQSWDSGSPVEYDQVRYYAGSGEELVVDDDLAPAETLPAESFSDVVLDGVRLSGATWLGLIATRTAGWLTRIPEIVELECVGLKMAQLTPGDLVLLTTAQLGGRDATVDAPTFDQRVCLVVGLSPDPFTASVTVILAIRPVPSPS